MSATFLAHENAWAWKRAGRGPLWWRFLADVLIWGPQRELRLDYLHHRAASAGMIAESPLYDVDLIEFVLRLPPELAFDWRQDRPLARAAMAGRLPDSVRLQGAKADFSPFALQVMSSADADSIGALLTDPGAEIGRYVRLEWVRDAWARVRGGEENPYWIAALWHLAAAELWLLNQADPGFPDALLSRAEVPAPSYRRVPVVD